MASTYVNNFTLIDTINAQSVADTQYNSNEGVGSINEDLYAPTATTTHTIPTAIRSFVTGALLDDGIGQKSLYELLLMIQINWDTAMASLDDSGGVAATTFVSTAAIGGGLALPLSANYNSAFTESATGLGLGLEGNTKIGLNKNGIGTRELAIFCQAIATQFAVATALLDADATITDTNYASTLNILFTPKTGWAPPLTTTTRLICTEAFSIIDLNDTKRPNPASRITVNGVEQEALIDFLNTAVTNINALWVKLDTDI